MVLFKDLPRPLRGALRFILHDEVRIFEVFSALNLLSWAWALWRHPEMLARPSYQAFATASSSVWALVALLAGSLQVAALVTRHRYAAHLRFPAMALAAGAWTVVAVHFWSGPPSTGTMNYTLLALGAAISGIFLGWKPTSSSF